MDWALLGTAGFSHPVASKASSGVGSFYACYIREDGPMDEHGQVDAQHPDAVYLQ